MAIDLEDAFSYVTEEMLFAQMRRQNALPKALKHPKGVLELAAELMTYKGQLPQGCAHSGVAYALAIRPLSQALLGCARCRGLLLTIYADNMLFSSAQSFWSSQGEIFGEIGRIVSNRGFRIGGHVYYEGWIEYLGVVIEGGGRRMLPSKEDEFARRIRVALAAPLDVAKAQYKSIVGLWAWAQQVGEVPPELLRLFAEYFLKVGSTPKSFEERGFMKRMRGF